MFIRHLRSPTMFLRKLSVHFERRPTADAVLERMTTMDQTELLAKLTELGHELSALATEARGRKDVPASITLALAKMTETLDYLLQA